MSCSLKSKTSLADSSKHSPTRGRPHSHLPFELAALICPKGRKPSLSKRKPTSIVLMFCLGFLSLFGNFCKKTYTVRNGISITCILLYFQVSVGKGLVMGWLRFAEAGNTSDCINRPNTAYPIPVHVEDIKDIVSVARYIIVVEKESVFQRLANDQFCSTNQCIVITGRGYPDISTRRFFGLLVDTLHLPVYCLVDCDPYGFDILSMYRFGSLQMAYDAKFLRVPEIIWLGAFPLDAEKYHLPKQCLLPLTADDKRKTESLLQRCYLEREVPHWRLELQLMLESGVKFELEALSVHKLSFLSTEYIPSKIQAGSFI